MTNPYRIGFNTEEAADKFINEEIQEELNRSRYIYDVGYDANQEDTGYDEIYPVLNGEQKVKCNIQYTEDIDPSDWMRGRGDGHDQKKHDRWKLVKSEIVFPVSLMKFYGTPKFNDVYDKPNGKFYKFVAPTNETK